jgi:hypothetical protein
LSSYLHPYSVSQALHSFVQPISFFEHLFVYFLFVIFQHSKIGVLGKAVMRKFAPMAGKAGTCVSVDLIASDVGQSVIVKKGDTNAKTILQTADEVYIGSLMLTYFM